MSKEQYKRANGVVFPMLMIIMGYVFVTLVAFMATADKSQISWKTYLQIITVIASIIATTFLFIAKRETDYCAKGMLIAATVMYVVMRLVGTTEDTCIYAFPIIVASMCYLNRKIVVSGNLIVIIVNAIRLFLNFDKIFEPSGSAIIVNIFVMILLGYASICVTKILNKFNSENMEEIMVAAKKQEENNNIMVNVAEDIINHFSEAMDMMDKLQESLNNSHNSMSNIVDSTESTAEAIQNQAEKCGEIRNQAENAGEVTADMIDSSIKVKDTVESGVRSADELRKQADNVSDSSKIVADVIVELTKKVKEVESFVDSIINISSQTNLLALNASIEAARAGEAGKGFAVVADEIRTLSEDTQEASNHITSIIQELNADSKLANESIENAVQSVVKQNELIEETKDKFTQVADEVVVLTENIDGMKNITEVTMDSANSIYDQITQLSATSEEVAAASNEGLDNSTITVEQVERCRKIFEAIYEAAQGLKNY